MGLRRRGALARLPIFLLEHLSAPLLRGALFLSGQERARRQSHYGSGTPWASPPFACPGSPKPRPWGTAMAGFSLQAHRRTCQSFLAAGVSKRGRADRKSSSSGRQAPGELQNSSGAGLLLVPLLKMIMRICLELRDTHLSCRAMKPDPDFEDFARDYLQLARQEKSLQLRSRLLVLAREWMHAAMQDRPELRPRRRRGKVRER
jgi:hypothetical protein